MTNDKWNSCDCGSRHSSFGIRHSLCVLREIFFLKLRHADRPVKPRANRFALDTVARGLHRAGDFLSGEKRVDATRGFFAFGHGVDDFASPIRAVAAGENFREIRLAGVRVSHDRALWVEFELWEKFLEQAGLLFLADGLDDHVKRLDEFRAG